MFDQRLLRKDLPKPAQWHRIAVHNDRLGAYAVKQFVKKYVSFFFVLRYMELSVYNFSDGWKVTAVHQFMLRVTSRLEFTTTASLVKLIIFRRSAFVTMV